MIVRRPSASARPADAKAAIGGIGHLAQRAAAHRQAEPRLGVAPRLDDHVARAVEHQHLALHGRRARAAVGKVGPRPVRVACAPRVGAERRKTRTRKGAREQGGRAREG